MIYNYQGNGIIFQLSSLEESKIFSYSDPRTSIFSTDDYGFITQVHSESIDYDQDLSPAAEGENYGPIVGFGATESIIAFGGLTLSGSVTNEKFTTGAGESTQLFIISGLAIERETNSYVGLGNLTLSGSALEAYSAQTPEDLVLYTFSGLAIERETNSYVGTGTLEISGLAIERETNSYVGTGTLEISGSALERETNSYVGTGTLEISGSALESFAPTTYITSGTLFSFGEKLESITYSYKEDSIIEGFVDYGQITELHLKALDYGQVLELPKSQSQDFSTITSSASEGLAPFGKLTLSGAAITQPNYRLFFYGSALERETNSYVGTGTLEISGSTIERETNSYVSLGNLTLSGSALETYSAQTPEDLVLYTFSGSALETYSAQTPEDLVIYTFSGSALEAYSAQTPEDLVLYTFSGSALETYSAQTPEDLVLYTFSGSALETYSAQTPEDTQLFIISGSALEAYSAQTPEDLVIYTFSGLAIERETNSYVGLGNLTLSGSALETYSAQTPENTVLYTLSGSALETYSAQTPENTVLYTFSGSALETYSAQTPEDTQLFIISGSALERETNSYVGLGNLTLSGSALEAYSAQTPEDTQLFIISGSALEAYSAQTPEDLVLYTFSGSALEAYSAQTPEDLVLYTFSGISSNREIQVYGYYGDDINPGTSGNMSVFGELVHPDIDYTPHYGIEQNIGIGTTGIQFSGSALETYSAQTPENTVLYTFSGIASTREIAAYGYYGDDVNPGTSGTLTLSGELVHPDIDYTPHYGIEQNIGIGTTGIQLYGELVERGTDSYVGIGTFFKIGIALESVTYDYNESSIATFQILDNGLITDLTETYINNGLIININDASLDNGLITTLGPTFPFGLFAISGELTHPNIDYTPHYGIEKNIGIGTTGIQLSGKLVESQTDSYVGLGTLFNIGIALERETNSYVGLGNLTLSGSALETYSAQTPENTVLYTFSGSALEAYSAQTPEDTQLFIISGSALERETNSYVGTGTLEISGSALERETNSYVGLGNLTLSGSALEAYSAQTPEDTQLFIISGSALERFIADTPEDLVLYTFSGISSNREIQVYGYYGDDVNPGTSGTLTLSGELVHPDIDYTPHYGIEQNIGIGTTGIQFSGSALEAYSAQTPEDTQLFIISGSALETYSAQTPEDLVLYTFSGLAIERETNSYVGLGNLTLSGSALETYSAQTPENTVLYTFSGIASTREIAAYGYYGDDVNPGTSGTLTLSGELVHPDIDYTPHYGIEQNIGIGTFGIRFVSGVGFTPDSEGNLRDARTYSNVYPGNDKVPGTGIGTFKFDEINNTARYGVLTPYKAKGTILLNGIGLESFSITNYDGSGLLTFSGISSNREINVYGYYGDDANPGTSGIITISQQTQPSIEKHTESYIGIGNVIKFGTLSDERIVNDYTSSGVINLGKIAPTVGTEFIFSSAIESFSAQTPEDTQLFSISGSALEAYSAQTPEDTVLYTFDESLVEKITKSYSGEGDISFSGNANEFIAANPSVSGNIRFTTHLSDNLYDTCDSIDITSDYQNSAFISFIANPPESTQLFSILGSGDTSKINLYEYVRVVNLTFSGSLVERETDSYVGYGILFTLSDGSEVNTNSYEGGEPLFTISGVSESKYSQTSKSTILTNIFGTASTKLESDYSYSGIGTAYITGSASTKLESDYSYSGIGSITLSGELIHPDIQYVPAFKQSFTYSGIGTAYITGSASTKLESDYSYSGIGSITLSGELIHPDIQFIPTPKGFGLFALSGISSNSISRISILSGNKTLFAFSGGFESFSRSKYVGLGTVYIQQLSGIVNNNPFEIPRTYIVII